MERDFSFDGKNFKISKLNAFKQFHIARRVAPLMSRLLPVMAEIAKTLKNEKDMSEQERFDQIVKIGQPVLQGLSELPEKDADTLLKSLLAAVEMEQDAGNWAYIVVGENLMFQNLELSTLLAVAGRAFIFNLKGFIPAPR